MRGFLLDTHIWIWGVGDDPRLPRRLRSVLRNPDDCWLSPISLWEIAMLARKNRIRTESGIREWTSRAFDIAPLHEATVTFEVAERAEGLLNIGDPADTLIAATAMTYDLTLVTVDSRLRRVKGLRTLSH